MYEKNQGFIGSLLINRPYPINLFDFNQKDGSSNKAAQAHLLRCVCFFPGGAAAV